MRLTASVPVNDADTTGPVEEDKRSNAQDKACGVGSEAAERKNAQPRIAFIHSLECDHCDVTANLPEA